VNVRAHTGQDERAEGHPEDQDEKTNAARHMPHWVDRYITSAITTTAITSEATRSRVECMASKFFGGEFLLVSGNQIRQTHSEKAR
jgi:hypothetical protein